MAEAAALPEQRLIPYLEARQGIEDADVILFRGNAELSELIADISESAYSHAGIVLTWFGRRMLLSAEDPKVQAVPLSIALASYNGRVDWYKLIPLARAHLDMRRFALEALANLGIEYGTSKLFELAAHFVFGADVEGDGAQPSTMVCSQYVSRCFRLGGVDLSTKSDLATVPGEIAASPLLRYIGTLEKPALNAEQLRAELVI